MGKVRRKGKKKEKRKGKKEKKTKEKKGMRESALETKGKEIVREEKKKGTTIPFVISNEPAVETRRVKKQSWSTRRELRVGTRNCGFCSVPKGRGFSYTGYFLPRGYVRTILVQL